MGTVKQMAPVHAPSHLPNMFVSMEPYIEAVDDTEISELVFYINVIIF